MIMVFAGCGNCKHFSTEVEAPDDYDGACLRFMDPAYAEDSCPYFDAVSQPEA
jgi:hypothetical protein